MSFSVLIPTWQKFIIIRNTKKKWQMITNVTTLRINEDIPENMRYLEKIQYIQDLFPSLKRTTCTPQLQICYFLVPVY